MQQCLNQCGTDVKPVSHKPSYCSLRHVNSSRLENLVFTQITLCFPAAIFSHLRHE